MAGQTWPLSDDTAEEVLDDKLCRCRHQVMGPCGTFRSDVSRLSANLDALQMSRRSGMRFADKGHAPA
jgi:hypothetical protein